MSTPLLGRLSAHFVLVVGKGGVGKSTTAGAIALEFAESRQPTHLISTDPAHSIADLFDQQLPPGQATPCSCNKLLTLEEFNARSYAASFFARVRAPLTDLIERGTYLDAQDAAGFIDLSLPGIDEVMAALRLVELKRTDLPRIIVDTAPTGHTLRLLEAGQTIRSWIAAARAMADKANVVAAHLVRGQLQLPAESLLQSLVQEVDEFEREVLTGDFVLVTRAGDVVAAETARLRSELERRELRVAAELVVASSPDRERFSVPELGPLTGCAGLKTWAAAVAAPRANAERQPAADVSAGRQQSSVGPRTGDVAQWLRAQPLKLVWVAGKGGVGKSTCASAMAATLAPARRVCLVSTDPAGSLDEILAQSVTREGTEIAPNLIARQIDAPAEFKQLREQYQASVQRVFESFGLASRLELDRRVIESLWEFAPPGIDEIIALVDILEQAPEYDVLVIDSAPTGHFLRLLELPEIALEWVHSLLRLLLKYRAVGSLDALAQDLLAFAKRLRQLNLDLSTPDTTAVFLVSLPEALVRSETDRLATTLSRAGITVAATILNRADAGSKHASDTGAVIKAPALPGEIVGLPALRAFLEKWEFSSA